MRCGLKFAISLTLALLFLASCGRSTESEIAKHLDRADRFYSHGMYGEAAIEYENVLRLSPNHRSASRKLALSYLATDDFEKALPVLLKSRDLDPQDAEIRIALADVYLMFDRPRESRREVEFVLEKKPGDPGALEILARLARTPAEIADVSGRIDRAAAEAGGMSGYNLALGTVLMKKGEMEIAREALLLAVGECPDGIGPRLALGDLALAKKEFREAEIEYRAAAELAPEKPAASLKLCDVYLHANDFGAAKAVLQKLVQKSPVMRPALYRLAVISLEERKADECAGYLEEIFRSDPADPQGIFIRGRLHLLRREAADAAADLQTVAKANPELAVAHYFLGLACIDAGDNAQARASLREAAKLAPELTGARLNLALIAIEKGAFDEASAGLTAILNREPNNFEALVMLSEAVQSSEGVHDALKRLQNVESAFGGDARYRLALGNLLFKSGDAAGAEKCYRSALEMKPGMVEAHWALGAMYLARNNWRSAEQEYREAREAAPDNPAACARLADFYVRRGNPAAAKQVLADCTARFPAYVPGFRVRAEIALEQKDFGELTGLVDAMLRKNPSDLGARILKGRMNLAQKKAPDALREFREAEKLHPGTAEVPFWIGMACLESGDMEGARAGFVEALDADPGSAAARLRLAEIDVRQGLYLSAIDNIENAFDKRPKPTEALRTLGAAYLGRGDGGRAAACFAEILKTHPFDAPALYFMGVSLRLGGRNDQAARYLEKAMQAAPGSTDPVIELARIYVSENKRDQAVGLVRSRLEASPENARLYLLLGTLLPAGKGRSEAEAALLRGIEIDPALSPCRLELAKIYSAAGRRDEALAVLEQGIANDPRNVGLLMASGTLHQQKGEAEAARAAYEKSVELEPENALALNNLAYILAVRFSDYEKALRLARRAKELDPDNPRVADTLGWVLYLNGNAEWSLGYLRESASKIPDNPEVQYHLGMALQKLGNPKPAREALKRALQLDPDFPAADEIRQTLSNL